MKAIENRHWVSQIFGLPRMSTETGYRSQSRRNVYESIKKKFTDTTLGGNYTINNTPQFTRFADIKQGIHPAPYTPTLPTGNLYSGSKGMGRYYSESIDDNSIRLHLRVGIPRFNSLTAFYKLMYDPAMSAVANTGEEKGTLYTLGYIVGSVIGAPLLIPAWIGRTYRFMTGQPVSKYYYLRPSMYAYWRAVDNLVNNLSANMGLTEFADTGNATSIVETNADGETQIRISGVADSTLSTFQALSKQLPDVYDSGDGTINIFAVATRVTRISNAYQKAQLRSLQLQGETLTQKLWEGGKAILRDSVTTINYDKVGLDRESINNRFQEWLKEGTKLNAAEADAQSSAESKAEQEVSNNFSNIWDYFKSGYSDGYQWVSFKVNPDDTAGESFSNSVKDAAITEKLNGMAKGARDLKFSFSNGNISEGVIGSTAEAVLGAVGNVIEGVADGVGIGGLAGIGKGAGFAEIPKVWDDSSADMNKMDFKIELRSPYGNRISIMQNIYIPLCMLLAMALPLSTGKRSYTSPFLVEAFCKGRGQCRLGIIDSMSITRGTGNVGWSVDHMPLAVDVNISILPLDDKIHMPISGTSLFEEDNILNDYMQVLSGMSLADQIYASRRILYNYRKVILGLDKKFSKARIGSSLNENTFVGAALSAFAPIISR